MIKCWYGILYYVLVCRRHVSYYALCRCCAAPAAAAVGKLSWFLGMEIDQSSDYSITINQCQYVDKMVERFVPMTKS